MTREFLPRQDVAFVDGSARATTPFYVFLQALERLIVESGNTDASLAALITQIATLLGSPDGTVENIPPLPGTGNVFGQGSVQTFGLLADGTVFVTLYNDTDEPGPTYHYATGPDGVKGWYPVEQAFEAASGELTKDVDADTGVTTFGLADVTPAPGGTLQLTAFDDKGRRSEEGEATTSHLPEGSNLYYTDSRADARITAAKADPDGIASLVGGKLDAGQLPALAITETFVVNTQAAMLALVAQQGDVAVRSDEQKSYILTAEPASTLSNWQELLVPTGVGVASFNGRTGSVVPVSGDYTAAQVGAETAFASGTTAQYFRGDKTFQGLKSGVLAEIPSDEGAISGLRLSWNSGTSISVSSGFAYVPSLARLVKVTSALTASSLSLSSATWYHVYLYESSGAAIEVVSTAPSSAYSGYARTKTGDASRRYIGSVRTRLNSANVIDFLHSGEQVMYRENPSATVSGLRVINGGTASSATTVSAANGVPPTASVVVVNANNFETSPPGNAALVLAATGATGTSLLSLPPGIASTTLLPLNASQQFDYRYNLAPSGVAAYVDICGYIMER